MAHTVYLDESLCLWELSLGQLLDGAVILLDLHCHVTDLMEQRAERNGQPRRHHRQAALREAQCRRGWKAVAARLRQSTDRVHCACSQAHQDIASTDQRQCL